MADFENFSGLPEVGIGPRAPHAGPLRRHVGEPEHGRGRRRRPRAGPAAVTSFGLLSAGPGLPAFP